MCLFVLLPATSGRWQNLVEEVFADLYQEFNEMGDSVLLLLMHGENSSKIHLVYFLLETGNTCNKHILPHLSWAFELTSESPTDFFFF